MPLDSLKQARILIVDDALDNVELLEMMLRVHGYAQLASTTDSRETERLYHEFRPDLLLLDLAMPVVDGFAVLARLKEVVPEHEFFPILVLTGDISTATKERALREGARDFLTKPFDQTEVLLRIENLLQTRFLH